MYTPPALPTPKSALSQQYCGGTDPGKLVSASGESESMVPCERGGEKYVGAWVVEDKDRGNGETE